MYFPQKTEATFPALKLIIIWNTYSLEGAGEWTIKSQKMCPQYSSKYTLARHGCTGITQQFPVSGQLSDHAYSGYQAPIFLPHKECGYKATL